MGELKECRPWSLTMGTIGYRLYIYRVNIKATLANEQTLFDSMWRMRLIASVHSA